MGHPLFIRFLEDAGEYAECQKLWEHMLTEATRSHGGSPRHWLRWIRPELDETGNEIPDGNPIFDGLHVDRERGFRIIQHRWERSSDREMSTWFNHFPHDAPGLPPVELVFNLTLTDATSTAVCAVLALWTDLSVGRDRVESLIMELGATGH